MLSDMTQGLPGLRSADPEKRLGIYLNDHLAGAMTGVELARRAASNNRGTTVGDELSRLAEAIAEDVEELKDLMRRLEVSRDRLKESFAWGAEKLGRLKLNGQLLGYSPLSRLIELEGLSIGVTGKLALWEALEQVLGSDQRLAGFDLERMLRRAREQRAVIERLRLDAARAALDAGR